MPIVRCSVCNSFVSKTGICKRCSRETKIEQIPITVFNKERDRESNNWSIDNQTLLNAKLLKEIGQLRGRIETLEQDYERVVQLDKELRTNQLKCNCIKENVFNTLIQALHYACVAFDNIQEEWVVFKKEDRYLYKKNIKGSTEQLRDRRIACDKILEIIDKIRGIR